MANCSGPYKQKNGKNYYIRWTDRYRHDRKQVRETLKTDNQELAKDRKDLLVHQFLKGEHDPWKKKWYNRNRSDLDNPILLQAIEEFIAYKKNLKGAKGWGKHQKNSAPYVLEDFAESVGEATQLNEITENDLQNFLYNGSLESDHSRKSYNRIIRTFQNWCVKKGYLDQVVDFHVDKPQKQIPKFLKGSEIKSLCDYHIDENLENIKKNIVKKNRSTLWMPLAWWLLARTGLRPSELMKLKTSHIDLESGLIIIGEDFLTKSRNQRNVPIFEDTEEILRLILDSDFRNKDTLMKDHEWLFGRHGDQAQKRLSKKFSKARDEKFPDKEFTLYNLRHTFAVWFLTRSSNQSKGHRLYDLMRILGHSRLETTQQYLQAVPYQLTLSKMEQNCESIVRHVSDIFNM